jgi:hypothetical protein
MGKNPRLIRGDLALPIQLARGLRGETRISSYVEQGAAERPADTDAAGTATGQKA